MGAPIDLEWAGCGPIGCWTHHMTLNFHPTNDLLLRFSRSNFQIVISLRLYAFTAASVPNPLESFTLSIVSVLARVKCN